MYNSVDPSTRLACSYRWADLMDCWLTTACKHEAANRFHLAHRCFRRALAIERLHRMVTNKVVPMFSLTKQAWIPQTAPEKGIPIAA